MLCSNLYEHTLRNTLIRMYCYPGAKRLVALDQKGLGTVERIETLLYFSTNVTGLAGD